VPCTPTIDFFLVVIENFPLQVSTHIVPPSPLPTAPFPEPHYFNACGTGSGEEKLFGSNSPFPFTNYIFVKTSFAETYNFNAVPVMKMMRLLAASAQTG
jgi:hypothetical protein